MAMLLKMVNDSKANWIAILESLLLQIVEKEMNPASNQVNPEDNVDTDSITLEAQDQDKSKKKASGCRC